MSLTISQAKEIMEKKGWDFAKIDWDSYSNDIDLQDWLYNEYGYIVHSNTELYEQTKAAHDMADAYYRKEEPYQPSLSIFDDDIPTEPIKTERIESQQEQKPLIIRLEYPESHINLTINSKVRKTKLRKGILNFIEGIKAKLNERKRFIEWNEYVNKVLVPNVEIEIKEVGRLEIWR